MPSAGTSLRAWSEGWWISRSGWILPRNLRSFRCRSQTVERVSRNRVPPRNSLAEEGDLDEF